MERCIMDRLVFLIMASSSFVEVVAMLETAETEDNVLVEEVEAEDVDEEEVLEEDIEAVLPLLRENK